MPSICLSFKYIVRVLAILALAIMLFSCGLPTSGKHGVLIGSVVLQNDTDDSSLDPIDFSGITVAIYSLAELDTTILRINQQHPSIGVHISQETEFDHRTQPPIKTTVTAADGSFKLQGITPARYNIVFSKEGWGYQYVTNYKIAEGENQINNKSACNIERSYNRNCPMLLYPTREITGVLQGDVTFKADRTYIAIDNSSITGNVILEGGARFLIAANKSVNVMGSILSSPENNGMYSLISSVDLLIQQSGKFSEILVSGSVDLYKCVIEESVSGMRVMSGDSVVQNCIVRNGSGGLTWTNASSVNVENSIATNIKDQVSDLYTGYAGIYTIGSHSANMNKLILKGNSSGVKLKDFSYGSVSNCYFVDNSWAVELYSSEIRVHHNTFERSDRFDLRVCGHQLHSTIDYNNFHSSEGIVIGLDVNYNYINCTPLISNNNLYSDQVSMHLLGYNSHNITAINNFFNITNSQVLQQRIIDRNDFDPANGSNMVMQVTGYIDYIPFRGSQVIGSGIQ